MLQCLLLRLGLGLEELLKHPFRNIVAGTREEYASTNGHGRGEDDDAYEPGAHTLEVGVGRVGHGVEGGIGRVREAQLMTGSLGEDGARLVG